MEEITNLNDDCLVSRHYDKPHITVYLFYTADILSVFRKNKKKAIFRNIERGSVEKLNIGTIQTDIKQKYISYLAKLTHINFNGCSFKNNNIDLRSLIHLKSLIFKVHNLTTFNLPENLENIKIICAYPEQVSSIEICKTLIRCVKQTNLKKLKVLAIQGTPRLFEMLDIINNSSLVFEKLVIFNVDNRSNYEFRRVSWDIASSIMLFKDIIKNTVMNIRFNKTNTKLEIYDEDYEIN